MPQHLFLLSPKAWTLFFKNCGVVKVLKRQKEYSLIEHSNMPAAMCVEDRYYIESFVGSYKAIIEICEQEGDAKMVTYDREKGRAVIEARWSVA